jgi:hypothetical protein
MLEFEDVVLAKEVKAEPSFLLRDEWPRSAN